MRAFALADNQAIAAASTTNQTPVAMTGAAERGPIMPGFSAVALVNLKAAANTTINIQKSETDSGSDWVTVGSLVVTAAQTRLAPINLVSIGQRMRAQSVSVASGAGTFDVLLIQH
jgi:hypothetical protein